MFLQKNPPNASVIIAFAVHFAFSAIIAVNYGQKISEEVIYT